MQRPNATGSRRSGLRLTGTARGGNRSGARHGQRGRRRGERRIGAGGTIENAWQRLRYGCLLAAAARSRRLATAYAELVGTVDLGRDPQRRDVATRRIARWLDVTPRAARAVFRSSLVSEAREEADSAYAMRHVDALERVRAPAGEPPHLGPTIYATLHFGSPILAYLHLARTRAIALHMIGRRLAPSNPMPEAKRRFGMRKVAWIESLAGRPFVDIDAVGMLRAREHLLAGESLYAAVDVPGDVVRRVGEVTLCGERIRVAAGIEALAALTHTPIQLLVGVHRASGIEVHYGRRIAPGDAARTLADAMGELATFIRRFPGEWWLWPYVTSAEG